MKPKSEGTDMASKAKMSAETVETAMKTGADALKDGFDKAAKGYDKLVSFNKDTAEAVLKSANLAGKGFETLNSEVLSYSRQSVEESVAVTKAILASKTIQEVIEIQTDYAKTAFETYVSELTKVRDMALNVAKTASEPLQARMAALVEMGQIARVAV